RIQEKEEEFENTRRNHQRRDQGEERGTPHQEKA
uniref:Uncharacterized protein n=1 Tax=Parascaris equorum TaxID=6256 RepID=A0A914RBB1_PAREQ